MKERSLSLGSGDVIDCRKTVYLVLQTTQEGTYILANINGKKADGNMYEMKPYRGLEKL